MTERQNERSSGPRGRRRRRGGGYIHIRRGVVPLLAVPVLGLAALLAVVGSRAFDRGRRPAESPVRQVKSAAGPWGDLAWTPPVIEAPDALVPGDFSTIQMPVWRFRGHTAESLGGLLRSAGVDRELVEPALAAAAPDPEAGGVLVRPSRELVLALSPQARATIYGVLAQDERNPEQAHPYWFPSDSVEQWFAQSGLSDQTLARFKRMLYPRGSLTLFSDAAVLMLSLASREEKIALARTLSRTPTVFVKLRIGKDTDTDKLVEYWGQGGRRNDVEPLFELVHRIGADEDLDVIHLLPPFARRRVYTYPSQAVADQQHCYWTALNFWNDQPEDRFSDLQYVGRAIGEGYVRVFGERRLGDLMVVMNRAGQAIHACVFVADDVVFTKNGPGTYCPWTLMRLTDVQALYGHEGEPEVQTYRPRS
jgi:hypothetical protein